MNYDNQSENASDRENSYANSSSELRVSECVKVEEISYQVKDQKLKYAQLNQYNTSDNGNSTERKNSDNISQNGRKTAYKKQSSFEVN